MNDQTINPESNESSPVEQEKTTSQDISDITAEVTPEITPEAVPENNIAETAFEEKLDATEETAPPAESPNETKAAFYETEFSPDQEPTEPKDNIPAEPIVTPAPNPAPQTGYVQYYSSPQPQSNVSSPAYGNTAQPVYPNNQAAGPVTPAQNYYYMPVPTQNTQPAPKKRNKGTTAFLICMWVLIGVFALGFFGLCGYIIGSSAAGSTDTTAPTFFDEDKDYTPKATEPVTQATEEDEDSGVIAIPDDSDELYSSDTSINLKDIPSDNSDKDKYTTQYAYKKVAESTIGVVCYQSGYTTGAASQGTGIILTEDGYIATNSHVIGDSRSLYDVQVITNDGITYEAKVIGFDSRTDLAVLKINAEGLTPAEFCNSDYVEVGEDVIAVGNPGGMDFQNSLTRGVVSALNRELSLSAQVTYIQTDAAINPGNSGGPLCNMYGQVIGINTAKISDSSYEGMGFAIPSTTVKDIVDDLISQGYVNDRVRLGIAGQEVSSGMQQYYSIPAGILVGKISEGGPCDGSGLKINDIITALDGEEVSTFSEVYGILEEHKAGDKITLTVYRMNTENTLEITVTLMADEGETQE